MRKLIVLAAAISLGTLPALAGASLKVFACVPEWGALVKEIAGPEADVYVATTALQNPHQVQARPSLIAHYRSADLAVCTGAELEIGWLPVLLSTGGNPRIQPGKPGLFEASDYVRMLDVPASVDRAQGDIHPKGNPHIQTDPRNIGKVIRPLTERLADLDPGSADVYRTRSAQFEQRWNEALARWTEQAKPLRDVAVISHHKSWVYLYDWLGIREVATLEPKPGMPPSAAHLSKLVDLVKREPVRMIVRCAYEEAKPSEFLAGRSGLPTVELPFTVGAEGGDDLFKLYQITIERLLEASKAGSKP